MKRSHLHTHMTILLSTCILIPLIFVSSLSYIKLRRNTEDSFKSILNNNVSRVSDSIDNISKSNSESADFLSIDPNARSLYKNFNIYEPRLTNSLSAYMDSHKNITTSYVGLSNKKMILFPIQHLPTGFDPTSRSWYKTAMEKNDEVIITEPYLDASTSGGYTVTFAKVVNDIVSNKPIGVAGIDIDLYQLSQLVSNIKVGQSGYITVADTNGNIIAHPNKAFIGKTLSNISLSEILSKADSSFSTIKINNKINYTYQYKNAKTNWQIIGVIPKAELDYKVNSLRNMTLIVCIVCLILSIFAGIFFSKIITKDIKELVTVLKKVSDGDFTQSVPVNKNASIEIYEIASSTNNMIDKIVNILQNVVSTANEVKECSTLLLDVTSESSRAGEEVSRAVQDIAIGASSQAQGLNSSASTTINLGHQINTSIDKSNNMTKVSLNVKMLSQRSKDTLDSLVNNFKETSFANKEVAQNVEILAQSSNKISVITDTLKSITEQTNLLALNASIEAARAGESGRGFAVVADEVRKLAEQSASSATEIYIVITEVKTHISSVLEKLSCSMELNNKTENSISLTGKSFDDILFSLNELEQNIETLNLSLNEINDNKDTVIKAIEESAAISEETAAATQEVSASSQEQSSALEEIAESAKNLNKFSTKLEELVNKFKL